MQYKTSKGVFVILMTMFVFSLMAWFIKIAIDSIDIGTNESRILIVAASMIFILSVISYLLAPRKYFLDNSSLKIIRFSKDIEIDYNTITKVSMIPNGESWKFVRSFGIGGLFGNIGKFYHMRYKNVTFYATRITNLVLIETRSKDYAISPSGTDFIEQLEKKINE